MLIINIIKEYNKVHIQINWSSALKSYTEFSTVPTPTLIWFLKNNSFIEVRLKISSWWTLHRLSITFTVNRHHYFILRYSFLRFAGIVAFKWLTASLEINSRRKKNAVLSCSERTQNGTWIEGKHINSRNSTLVQELLPINAIYQSTKLNSLIALPACCFGIEWMNSMIGLCKWSSCTIYAPTSFTIHARMGSRLL